MLDMGHALVAKVDPSSATVMETQTGRRDSNVRM